MSASSDLLAFPDCPLPLELLVFIGLDTALDKLEIQNLVSGLLSISIDQIVRQTAEKYAFIQQTSFATESKICN